MIPKDTTIPSMYSSSTMPVLDAIARSDVPPGRHKKTYCHYDESRSDILPLTIHHTVNVRGSFAEDYWGRRRYGVYPLAGDN